MASHQDWLFSIEITFLLAGEFAIDSELYQSSLSLAMIFSLVFDWVRLRANSLGSYTQTGQLICDQTRSNTDGKYWTAEDAAPWPPARMPNFLLRENSFPFNDFSTPIGWGKEWFISINFSLNDWLPSILNRRRPVIDCPFDLRWSLRKATNRQKSSDDKASNWTAKEA